ncbi:MAG TPA: hypothetical protein VLE73_03090 [Candidatus Saccharimonadales bacterium]|nr:hypothetical protein [Candidatus Saccharimonadales bacterium]
MKKPNLLSSQAVTCAVLVGGILLITGTFMLVLCTAQYRQNSDLAATSVTRDLIIRAAAGTKTDAVIEAKTGDVYFPQAKLYVPNNPELTDLTYEYDANGPNGPELDVSSRGVFERYASRLYNANNTTQLFERIPKLQACQRGITAIYKPLDSNDKQHVLQQTTDLGNGKMLYVYSEKACPELIETADALKDIASYE